MKFSVVIPTHNGLNLLRSVVETVRRQRWLEWELVIFDNASADDIAGYVRSLTDPRVVYRRSDVFLSVTESWNSALDLASGDYVTLLGDDDGLTPDYFVRIRDVLNDFGSPEVVYTAIYQFLHPGVAPWEPQGYLAVVKNGFFFVGRQSPFRLSVDQAVRAVRGSIRWRRNFAFNIQAFSFSRTLLQRLRQEGSIFRSPFPDYYLANVALAKSQSTVVIPEPLCVAGVSKASFGYTLLNDLESKGAAILNSQLEADPVYADTKTYLLPGSLYNTKYLITMEYVRRASSVIARQANVAGYRRVQLLSLLIDQSLKWRHSPTESHLWRRLSIRERRWALGISLLLRGGQALSCRGKAAAVLNRLLGPYSFKAIVEMRNVGSYSDVLDVFDSLSAAPDVSKPRAMLAA